LDPGILAYFSHKGRISNQISCVSVEYSSSDSMVAKGVPMMMTAIVAILNLTRSSYWWWDINDFSLRQNHIFHLLVILYGIVVDSFNRIFSTTLYDRFQFEFC